MINSIETEQKLSGGKNIDGADGINKIVSRHHAVIDSKEIKVHESADEHLSSDNNRNNQRETSPVRKDVTTI